MPAELEVQRRTIWIADVDPLTVVDVDARHPTVVHVQPVEAAVVDSGPPALVIAQQQVDPGDQRIGDADVGAQVTSDSYIVARCEGALGSVIPHGHRRGGWLAHQHQLYRHEQGLQELLRQIVRPSDFG
ncbi:hypothetical protein MBOU_26300 [Mycobacterium bourgelatii]|uniref:Uncharacterized protein n=1 Tax=Mycobacterium bourgelatii TaxID=1273442 RepID=A0A7I9YPP2_MYCBU|nr:hypothetical protein MBOU_26300 [Mycobacterium bourgelatii]